MIKYKYTEFEDIFEKLKYVVANDIKHKHYQRTLDIADFWYRMYTGTNHHDYITTYRPSESLAQKKQKFRVYAPRTKFVMGRANTTIKKSDRVDFAVDQISYEGSNAQEKKDLLLDRLGCYHANKSAKYWLNGQFNYLNIVDSNAFIAVNFYPFDPIVEKAHSYPIVIKSENAIDYERENGNLQYLVFDSSVTVKCEDDKTACVRRFHMLAPNYTICLEEIAENQLTANDTRETVLITKKGKKSPNRYFIEVYKTDSKNVPACSIGFVPDPITNGETNESIFINAKEILLDHITKKAELDVIILTHAIAKQFAYVPTCRNHDEATNTSCGGTGKMGSEKCGRCKGTGLESIHTSSQDIVTLNIGLNEHSDDSTIIDLSKLVHTQQIPTDVIAVYQEQTKQLEIDVSYAYFGVDVFTTSATDPKTPEAIRARNDSVGNVLFEYCVHKSEKYKFIVDQVADNMDQLDGLTATFKPSTDQKLHTLDDLLDQLEASKDAPKEVREAILDKIHHKQNQDSPDRINMIKAREKWRPFSHMTDVQIMNTLPDLPDYHPQRILWINFDRIFSDIENCERINIDETNTTSVRFHNINNHKLQKEILSYYINVYADEIKALEGTLPTLSDGLREISGSVEIETGGGTREGNTLARSVGGSSIVGAINAEVASRVLTREGGINRAMIQLGYDRDTAELLVPFPPELIENPADA